MNTIIYYPGTCPKCGSHNIKHSIWYDQCKTCGYIKAKGEK